MKIKIGIRNKVRLRLITIVIFILIIMIFLVGCQSKTVLPTVAAVAPTVETVAKATEPITESSMYLVPPTWTPEFQLNAAETILDGTLMPTRTPQSTKTPFPTLLPTLTRTSSPTPVLTSIPVAETQVPSPVIEDAPPTMPDNPILGRNILPNSSFEEGHYNMDGIPELQLPVGWVFEWDESETGFGTQSWDKYVRPETRVLSKDYLPEAEHSLFVFDGEYTIKAFKQHGAISFKLFRDVYLVPGIYVLEINVYPDMYMDYEDGEKVWADDPLTGQFRFIAPEATGWIKPVYGQKNNLTHTFTVSTAGDVRVGAAMRGNHAILNDGWFFDDWSLKRVEN